jgi:hypothetical protein
MVPISGSYRGSTTGKLVGKANPSERIQVSIYAAIEISQRDSNPVVKPASLAKGKYLTR